MSRSPADQARSAPSDAANDPAGDDARFTVSDSLGSRLREWLVRRVGIDLRALAALRISLALLLLADVLLRARFLRAFYTDAGVLPRSLLAERFPTFAALSVHALSGDAWFQAVLFVAAAALACSLAVGYRTRTVTLLSWLLLVSLHARNPMVLNGGDSLLRRLVFWSIFLPLGGRWSLDAVRSGARERPRRVATVAAAALLIQVVLVYATNAVYKHRGPAWRDGTAILQVVSLDQLTVLLGDHLAASPALVRPLGEFWLLLVTLSPLLLLLSGHARGALAAAFAGMHLGMLVTLRLGLFPLISVAGLLLFVPSAWWDVVERRVATPVRTRVGFTGGVDETAGSPGTDAESAPREPRDPATSGSGRTTSGGGPPATGGGGPTATRGGSSTATRGEGPTATREGSSTATPGGRAVTVFVTLLLVAVLCWNAAAVGLVETPDGVESSVDPSQFRWNMFAPYPPSTATWHVAPAELASGERIDAFQAAPVTYRPDDPDRLYPSARWRKYLGDATASGDVGLQREFARYLCARWNADHADRMERVRVVLVREPTNLDGPESTERVELVDRRCAAASVNSPGHQP